MTVYRVILHANVPAGVTKAEGDWIADNVAAASRFADIMALHPQLQVALAGGYTIEVQPCDTDPRFAVNYEGPRPSVSPGGSC